jgi:serine/threonine protein kinase
MAYLSANRLHELGYRSSEIKRFTDKYHLEKTLHSGKFNSVAIATNRETSKKVIVKTVYSKYYRKLREASFLKKLVHVPGVISYLDQYYINPSLNLLILEYFGEMTLKRYLEQNGPLSEGQAYIIFKQLVSIAQICYNFNIMHRKIKSSNFLVNKTSLKIKLTNFNSASHFDEENEEFNTALCPDIAPPEYFTKGSYSANGLYVWTLGLLLYEMFFACKPFNCPNDIVHKPCSIAVKNCLSIDAQMLISWMLTKPAKKRMSLNELVHHPWVTKKWI